MNRPVADAAQVASGLGERAAHAVAPAIARFGRRADTAADAASASSHPALRADLALVADQIPDGSRVLDLGCGSASLLAHLIDEHGCRGTGVEIDPEKVLRAIRRGVPIIEMDVDARLDDFADSSYDVCVLSRTIQTIHKPEHVLSEMARIAGKLVVSVPNFGWAGHRLRLLRGRMPMSKELPYRWYNTPNIRHTTLVDLERLFDRLGFAVDSRFLFTEDGRRLPDSARLANLRSGAAVYVVRPS